MKLLSIALLSFMVWKDPVHAFSLMKRSFCDKVMSTGADQEATENYNSCFELSSEFSEYNSTSLPFICMDTRIRSENPKVAKDYCESELSKLGKLETGEVQVALKSVYTGIGPTHSEHVPSEKRVSSQELDQCQNKEFLNKYNECSIANAPATMSLESISDILNHPSVGGGSILVEAAPVYGEADCKCLEKKIKADYKLMGNGQLAKEIQAERNRINGLIANAVGKKFLNAYASNMEDVRYYLTNKFTALGASEEEAANLQCNNAASFQLEIESSCVTNKIPKDIYEKRTKELLSSFGDDMSDPTLKGKFNKIDEFILNIKPDKDMLDVGPQRMFTRTEYDMIRNGASKKAPEINFMNTVINGVLNDSKLKERFETNLKSGQSPGAALGKILQEEKSPDVQSFMEKLIRENKNEVIFQELQGTLRTSTPDDYPQFIRDTYKIAVGSHPGLKAILNDKALFNELNLKRQNSYEKNPNLINLLESDSNLLNKHFSARCEKLRKNLAQAVCSPDEDHVKRVKRDDINKLMTQIIGKSNLPLKDLILCQMPEIEPKGVFNKLSFGIGDMLNRSDYLNRKLNPIANQDNGFSGTYRALNGKGRGQMKEIISTLASFTNEKRNSTSSIAKEISRAENFTTTNLAKAVVPEESSVARTINEALGAPVDTTSRTTETFTTAAPTFLPASVDSPSATNESKAIRSQLKDFLSDKGSDKAVDKLISNTKDEDVKELLRLKEEIARDNDKIMNLMRENDRSKLKSLEENYQALEKKYQEALKKKATPIPAVAQESDEQEERKLESSGTNNGSYMGGTDGGFASSRSSESSASRSNSTGGYSAGRAIASTSSKGISAAAPARETSRTDIILETNRIHSSDKQKEVKEIDQEIISFVNKHETDISTLQKLKDQGIILKYKILENGIEVVKEMKVEYSSMSIEAKQVLDKKIAHQGIRSNQFNNLEHEYLKARRAYSYSALKLILGIQAKKAN